MYTLHFTLYTVNCTVHHGSRLPGHGQDLARLSSQPRPPLVGVQRERRRRGAVPTVLYARHLGRRDGEADGEAAVRGLPQRDAETPHFAPPRLLDEIHYRF